MVWVKVNQTVYIVLCWCVRCREDELASDAPIVVHPPLAALASTGTQQSDDSHMTHAFDKPSCPPIFIEQTHALDRDRQGLVTNGIAHAEISMSELLDLPQDCIEMSYVQNVDNMVSGADVRSTTKSVMENNVLPSGGGWTGQITLLPPTAFLFKSNGMPLVSTNGCDDARLEMNSSSSSHLVSPPKLEKNWKHLPQPVSVRPVAEINIEGAGGDSLGGAVSLEELRSRHQFTSAAEELVYIRTRLKQCAQRLEQLRLVLNPNPPT